MLVFDSIRRLRRKMRDPPLIRRSAIGTLILAIILSVVLVVSIALLFFNQLKSTARTTENKSVLLEPAQCGQSAVQSLSKEEIKAIGRIINGEIARVTSMMTVVNRSIDCKSRIMRYFKNQDAEEPLPLLSCQIWI